MILVLALAAGLWGLGHVLRLPTAARGLMLGLLFVAVLAVQVALPEGAPLREATGGSAALWLLIGAAVAIVLAYRAGLGVLRARVRVPEAAPVSRGALSEVELGRYARHIVLREIGGTGQRQLKTARVLVVGAGGLGSPVLLYLAAAGVGTIGVIDPDTVEAGNLQRQVVHTDARIGMPKVFSAEAAMTALNPFIAVRPYRRALAEDMARDLFADYDLIVEGTDSQAARRLANETAVALGLPLLSAAIAQWEGQIALWHPAGGGPCYACVFPQDAAPGLAPSCAEAGVAGPLPGVLGSMLALEAVKVITGAGTPLRGRMLLHEALEGETRVIRTKARADCPVCGGRGLHGPGQPPYSRG